MTSSLYLVETLGLEGGITVFSGGVQDSNMLSTTL